MLYQNSSKSNEESALLRTGVSCETLVNGISKNDFCNFQNLATKQFFIFNSKFYIQVDCYAMGSPLGPIFASNFFSHHQENWMKKFPVEFKPSFYRRYVDDIFVLFEKCESAQLFSEYMFYKHKNKLCC